MVIHHTHLQLISLSSSIPLWYPRSRVARGQGEVGQVSLLYRYRGVWARRNASPTVHSKGTNADETNGPAEGV